MRAILNLTLAELRRFRGPLPALSGIFLLCVPLLYGAMYLWSNWDPYGHLNRLKVAVVNLDKPVTVEGHKVHGGADFLDELKDDDNFGWTPTSAADAKAGVASGKYAFSVTVPADFSKRLTSPSTGKPQQAQVQIHLDNSQGYIIGIMADTAQIELQAQLNAAAVKSYADAALGSLSTVRAALETISDGAGQLRDGSSQVSGGVNTLQNQALPLIHRAAGDLESAASEAASVSAQVSSIASRAAALTQQAQDNHSQVAAALDSLVAAHPELSTDPAVKRVRDASNQIGSLTQQANAEVSRVSARAGEVANAAATVRNKVPDIVAAANGAAADIRALNDGAAQVAAGNRDLAAGLEQASDAVPVLSDKQQAKDADALANPVRIDEFVDNPATLYGRGLAPFFFGVALWVFGLVAFVLMRPIAPRGLASQANPLAVALGGLVPSGLIGAGGAVILYAVTDLGLGLDPVQPAVTVGVSVLAVLAFTALAQFFRVLLGLVGGGVMLVLLIIQLGAAGGLYPVVTMPTFFQVAHPWVPMTYLVNALRVSISGGSDQQLLTGVWVLAGLLVGSLAATTLVAWRKRVFSTMGVHPPLEE